MSWQVGQRIVAEATGVNVRGSRFAGCARLHAVERLDGAPKEGSGELAIAMAAAVVRLTPRWDAEAAEATETTTSKETAR